MLSSLPPLYLLSPQPLEKFSIFYWLIGTPF